MLFLTMTCKKSLKIPKSYSEAVNRKKTDKTMTKKTNNNLQNTTQKTKDRATQTLLGYQYFSLGFFNLTHKE
jgi:hypothetical protein